MATGKALCQEPLTWDSGPLWLPIPSPPQGSGQEGSPQPLGAPGPEAGPSRPPPAPPAIRPGSADFRVGPGGVHSTMASLGDLLRDWHQGAEAVARGDWDCALRLFSSISEPPARVSFNPRDMKLQGFRGRSRNFSSPTMESRLQYVDHREQLKTFKGPRLS